MRGKSIFRGVVGPGPGRRAQAQPVALWKNPENLTERQKAKLDWITANEPACGAASNSRTTPANLSAAPGQAPAALDAWLSWARRSRLPAFNLARKISRQREPILTAITHHMSNALVESVNTRSDS